MFNVPFFSFQSPFRKSSGQAINIPPVETQNIETLPDKRARTLKHLIRANHVNHSILYNQLRFHNHMPHILGSAYLLGSTPQHLNQIYDAEAKVLEPWQDSPSEVSEHDWQNYLGDKRYQRAYVDFFEDELVHYGYDWRKLVDKYMFGGKEPLINSIVGGLSHPLIHLGYAFEFANQTLAIEALTLTATGYTDLHKYLDDPSYTRPAPHPTKSLLEIIDRVHHDERLDANAPSERGPSNIHPLLLEHEAALLEHWNSWSLGDDPTAQFEQSQRLATLLLLGTAGPSEPSPRRYDFFIVHVLTSSHAVRILLPLIPAEWHVPLVRQWWIFTLLVYVMQLRPPVVQENVSGYDLKGRGWAWAAERALAGGHATDAHYVKAIRATKEAAAVWGDGDEWFLRAGVRFAAEFTGWTGFGELSPEEVAFRDEHRARFEREDGMGSGKTQ